MICWGWGEIGEGDSSWFPVAKLRVRPEGRDLSGSRKVGVCLHPTLYHVSLLWPFVLFGLFGEGGLQSSTQIHMKSYS